MFPASQIKQFLLKTNYTSSGVLLPRAANQSLLFILNSVNLSVASFLHIRSSLLRPGTLAVYPVTLNGSFSVPYLEESASAAGGYPWAGLTAAFSWPSLLPPDFSFSLNLRLPLCYTDFLELFKKRSF